MGCAPCCCILCLYYLGILGHECGQEEDDTMRPSTSCSSPDENSYCGDELSYSLELMDEYAFDGEVGKRLTLMVPVPVSVAYIGVVVIFFLPAEYLRAL